MDVTIADYFCLQKCLMVVYCSFAEKPFIVIDAHTIV